MPDNPVDARRGRGFIPVLKELRATAENQCPHRIFWNLTVAVQAAGSCRCGPPPCSLRSADGDLPSAPPLRSGVKKRQESIEMFAKGGRPELVEKEMAELKVIEDFLPAGMGAAELEALVAEAIAETQAASMKDIGKIMKWIVPRIAGRADGAEVNKLIKARFSA